MNSRKTANGAGTETRDRRPGADNCDGLWERYGAARDIETRNALIETYMPIVEREARKVAAVLSHAVRPQELESAGTLGLIDSIDNFEPEQGFRFVTFCTPRVRGAMFDELRSWDWIPRATRAKLNKLERVIERFENCHGRAPNEQEVAQEMGMSEGEIRRLFCDRNRSLISLDAPWPNRNWRDSAGDESPVAVLEDKRGANPVRDLQKKEVGELVRTMLDKTERLVVTLYYYEQLNLREIGHVLGLTESRICQIHSKVVQRLKKQFA